MQHLLTGLILLLVAPILADAQERTVPELIVTEDDDQFGCIRWARSGHYLDEQQIPNADLLRVYTKDPKQDPGLPAMMGTYQRVDDNFIFCPRFPFIEGRNYWVWFLDNSKPNPKETVLSLEIPTRRSLEAPKVVNIFPSTDLWPANQLKFYLHFDQSMQAGFLQHYLKIYDARGRALQAPFLDMAQELWDMEQKRLTVWFDPGRIKSLLIPNQQMGSPLHANQTYRLVVKKGWPAANGLPLAEDQIKVFRTGHKDQQKPIPESWEVTTPSADTKQALVIYFQESMDMAMLQSGIAVLDQQAQIVPGKTVVGLEEKSWCWIPQQAWKVGTYRLRISTDLEDLAGNNLIRLFDTPIGQTNHQQDHILFVEELLIIE